MAKPSSHTHSKPKQIVPTTLEDIEKSLGEVMDKDKSQVTKAERAAISQVIDKHISQNIGYGYEVFSKVKAGEKEYGLIDVLGHIGAPKTLAKLGAMQTEKVASAVKGNDVSTVALVSDLIQHGADPNKPYLRTKSTTGVTLMHVLARCGAGAEFEDAVKNHDGNPNVTDGKGNTPAHYLLRNTAFMQNIEYLKPRGTEDSILIDHPRDLGVTKVAKTLNAMMHSGADFSLANHDDKTASAVFEDILEENIAKSVHRDSKEKVEALAKKLDATIGNDGQIVVTDKVISNVIGEGTNKYNWSGCRIIRDAIHDVTVDKKDAPVLYEGYETRKNKPILTDPAPKETSILGEISKFFSSVELKDANPDKLQAMTQRDALQFAAAKNTQIT
jgi:hypothetical protein